VNFDRGDNKECAPDRRRTGRELESAFKTSSLSWVTVEFPDGQGAVSWKGENRTEEFSSDLAQT